MAIVTNHATKRTKERTGLSKRLAGKNAERAFKEGIRQDETSGSLYRYIDHLYHNYGTANNIRIYCGCVYIFRDALLITVYKMPQRYRKIVDRIWRERLHGREGKGDRES